jgi:hypothetical protein
MWLALVDHFMIPLFLCLENIASSDRVTKDKEILQHKSHNLTIPVG